jgi:hypothetical protein
MNPFGLRQGWVLPAVLFTLGASVVIALLIWALFGFSGWGLEPHMVVAVLFGSLLTVALTVGLTILMIHSNRSGHDDAAGGPGQG